MASGEFLDVHQAYRYTCLKTYQYKISNSSWSQIMLIVIVKKFHKEYFATIKRFVYISVIIISNIENKKKLIKF